MELGKKIASPEFLSLLDGYENSVLIIEDAESILKKRSTSEGSVIRYNKATGQAERVDVGGTTSKAQGGAPAQPTSKVVAAPAAAAISRAWAGFSRT